MVVVIGGPIERIPKDWESGMAIDGLLGLINMPQFGLPTEVNACMKHLLACFHGEWLWLDDPIEFMVRLISEIMRLPKDGPYPSQ